MASGSPPCERLSDDESEDGRTPEAHEHQMLHRCVLGADRCQPWGWKQEGGKGPQAQHGEDLDREHVSQARVVDRKGERHRMPQARRNHALRLPESFRQVESVVPASRCNGFLGRV